MQEVPTQLVFFTARRSGPARRMDSLLAHVARRERGRLWLRRVDVDERPDLAERFRVRTVPTLVIVRDHRAVGRLEGRASAPQIDALLGRHLPRVELGAAA